MDLTTCIKEMGAAIEAYTERHGEEPNTLYMTARLMARIEAWVLRDGFVRGSYGYKSGFGMMPNGHVEWFSGLAVKLLDGEGDVCERCLWQEERAIRSGSRRREQGNECDRCTMRKRQQDLRWAVAREHIVSEEMLKGEGVKGGNK